MLTILIVEGNTLDAREQTVASGSITQSDLYERTLKFLRPDIHCDIICPADEGAILPTGEEFDKYDGIIWTGSSLNVYQPDPAITRQIEFMKNCYAHKTKIFGSCWGLQVAVVAAGGQVSENAKGREMGIACNIQQTVSGRHHPLYNNKTMPFDAVAIHLDHVVQLPEGATVLSGNDMSQVQALEIKRGQAIFWGVQYHPEFDLAYMATLFKKYKNLMVNEGFCPDEEAVDRLSSDFLAAQNNEKCPDIITANHNLTPDVLEPCRRLQEVDNWLNYLEK